MVHTNQAIFIQLLQSAKKAAENAYAPYSKFKVGAALITDDGKIFSGCNVENASYGLALCAERNAISSMVAAGHKNFKAIAICSLNTQNCYPCGACRQWINEFGSDITVIVENEELNPVVTSIKELLPSAFGPNNLTFL